MARYSTRIQAAALEFSVWVWFSKNWGPTSTPQSTHGCADSPAALGKIREGLPLSPRSLDTGNNFAFAEKARRSMKAPSLLLRPIRGTGRRNLNRFDSGLPR